jgi:hypothetical protein
LSVLVDAALRNATVYITVSIGGYFAWVYCAIPVNRVSWGNRIMGGNRIIWVLGNFTVIVVAIL